MVLVISNSSNSSNSREVMLLPTPHAAHGPVPKPDKNSNKKKEAVAWREIIRKLKFL